MNKLLRLALALFMSLNVLYADENDKLPLNDIIEYVYNFKGELSAVYFYDHEEILRNKVFFYYDNKGILIKHIEFDENTKNRKLFAYEYSNGKLIRIYEAKERFTASGIIEYEPIESAESWWARKCEYNRYGNLVYKYEYGFGSNSPIFKTKYEYENGKIIRSQSTNMFIRAITEECVCVYDSEQNLVESKVYTKEDGDLDLMFDTKYHFDGNRLSHTIHRTIWGEGKNISGKTKYEYDLKGRLIRAFTYGGIGVALSCFCCIADCGTMYTFYKILTESIHSKKTKMQ